MLSKKARKLKKGLKFIKPILKNVNVDVCRRAQDALGELRAKASAASTTTVEYDLPDCPVCMVTPVGECVDGKVMLYLHGGGYAAGSLQYARGFGCLMSENTRLPAFCVAYRLAPENPFPAAVQDAVAAYDELIEMGYAAKDIIFVGESAGGGLAFALCLALKRTERELPRAVVALSPWTDLTCSGRSYETNRDKDPSLFENQLRYYAEAYAPTHTADPLISPLFGDLSDMPPCLIIAGGDELLLDDSRRIAAKLLDAGCDCRLHVQEGMWHVFELYGMPESEEALGMINDFIKEMTA